MPGALIGPKRRIGGVGRLSSQAAHCDGSNEYNHSQGNTPNAMMAPQDEKTEIGAIADQFRRIYEGPAWHGPALKEILEGIGEERAADRALPQAHSIWELVLHTTAWIRIARERLSATAKRDHTAEENWPAITGSWNDTLLQLELEYRNLEAAVRVFPEKRLNEPAPATEPQTFYILLHGVIQHIAYHAGQMAILKK